MSAILFSKHSNFIVKNIDRMLVAALLVAVLSISSAKAEDEPRLVSLGEATTGALLFRSTEPDRFIEAPRLATDVAISVSGPIARTRVTQRFENTSDLWVEGVYVFPLPDESAVDTLKMQVGDRSIEGKIEEKKKAKEIYEAAKRAGKKASLLEQERPNIFTNSVANIDPAKQSSFRLNIRKPLSLMTTNSRCGFRWSSRRDLILRRLSIKLALTPAMVGALSIRFPIARASNRLCFTPMPGRSIL